MIQNMTGNLPYLGRPQNSSICVFSEWCLPGGQIVPTPRRSILHTSRGPKVPYRATNILGGYFRYHRKQKVLKYAQALPGNRGWTYPRIYPWIYPCINPWIYQWIFNICLSIFNISGKISPKVCPRSARETATE
jgi:hypothetical protein